MSRVPVFESPPLPARPPGRGRALLAIAPGALLAIELAQLIVLALDPLGFAIVAPLALFAVVVAAWFLITLYGARGELCALVRDQRTRVIHGLEHGCIKLLERQGAVLRAGQTHTGCFTIEIVHDGRISDETVRRAAREAAWRISGGEAALAFDPRCGTSFMIAAGLVSILIVSATVAGVVMGVPPGLLAASIAFAAALLWLGSRPLGLLAQRALTVSTGFAAARVERVAHTIASGHATFVVAVDVRLLPLEVRDEVVDRAQHQLEAV